MIVWLRRASRRNIQNGISILNPLESPLFPGKTLGPREPVSPRKKPLTVYSGELEISDGNRASPEPDICHPPRESVPKHSFALRAYISGRANAAWLYWIFVFMATGNEKRTAETFGLERHRGGLGRRFVASVHSGHGQHAARRTRNRLFHQLPKSNAIGLVIIDTDIYFESIKR